MKKQWLSIVLVLCMVLCMVPTTARAEESKTCELKITVGVNGLTGSAEGATFTFQIKKAINEVTAQYYEYGTMTVTVGADGTTGTNTIAVEEGKYIVQQVVPGDPIGEYVWYSISYTGGNDESGPQSVYGNGKSIEFKVYNTYKPANVTKVTTLPITVTGYKADAKIADAAVTTTEPGIKLSYFQFMEKDSAGDWTSAPLTGTFKADTEYRVEVYFNKLLGCDYTELKKENVTVNGVEADAFETTWSGFPYNKDYQVIRGLGKPEVVKTVKSIEIKTPPIKTVYMAGDKFDPTGMVVIAVYKEDGTTAVLPREKYVIFDGDKLAQGQKDVTIQYNDGSSSSNIKVRQSITVGPYVGDHQHTYDDSTWYADAKSHWHQCTDTDCPDPRGSTKDLASHTFVWKVDKAATTTQTGLKHEECTVCGHKRSENTEIPLLTGTAVSATTYPITVMDSKNGDVTASHKSAAKGTTITLTVDPDKGYLLDTLTVLDGKDKELRLTDKGDGKFTFTMPDSKVTVEATFKTAGNNPFTDVPAGAYYEDAVVWAVGRNITTGMSAAAFDPNGSCTRAQIVTFLWRAAGSPEPKTMKGFDDVASSAYYAKAVAWAVENGITTGTSASKFSPNDPCTRTQAVTFLFRYAAANGMEAVTMQELLSGYADAASVPSYAVSAMNWALAAGILQGDGVKLMPNATCTRAQIVTFLYRAMK